MKPTTAHALLTTINALEPRWLDQIDLRNTAKYGTAKFRKHSDAAETIENEASQLAFGNTNYTLLQSSRKAKLLDAAYRFLTTGGSQDCITFLNEEEKYDWEVNEMDSIETHYADTLPTERAEAYLTNFYRLANK
jgi:hypothetical protein